MTDTPTTVPHKTSSQLDTMPEDVANENGEPTPPAKSSMARCWSYLESDVDNKEVNLVSVYACFLTGFTSVHSFSVSGGDSGSIQTS